jgi:mono/diheme cytochrome c family protein
MVLKPVHIVLLFGTLLALALPACQDNDYSGKDGKVDGSKVYASNCVSCHGEAGDAGAGGAKNLKVSTMSRAEVIAIVTQGKGAMMPFSSLLNEAEREAVADYVISLRD